MARLELSVHQLVDFVLRKGDIDTRVFNRSSMNEGSLLHALYQSKQGDNYLSEYPLNITLYQEGIEIYIEGRADGIIKRSSKKYVIDEIKTTVIDLEEFFQTNEAWHLGQAELYALMFMKEKNLETIEVRLTYISQKHHSKKLVKSYFYHIIELENKVRGYIEEYLTFYQLIRKLILERNESLKDLKFPFTQYRKGQKELSKYAYALASKGGRMFVEAPTGIGKTMSTLFPYVKSLMNDDDGKVFYLTAKSSAKENAFNAIKILNNEGAKISNIVITAKEKICFCKGKACNPDECPYTKGYYSKISSIIKNAILSGRNFNYENIVNLAMFYEVCPFELELDLSLFLDVIICDYNYVYDPVSYMHRYFDDDASHINLLIDEAHNLVSRSRDMYSASISEEKFLLAKKSVKKSSNKPLKTIMSRVNKYFMAFKDVYKDENNMIDHLNDETVRLFTRFVEVMMDVNKNYHDEMTNDLLDFYLDVSRFMRIHEIANSSYIYNIKKEKRYHDIEMICLDASSYLRSINSRLKSTLFFSATLTPIDYYIDTLGGALDKDAVLKLDSPFPKSNFLLLIAPKVSVKYRNREASYLDVKSYIKSFIDMKVGNYLVFLPSYEYLERLLPLIDFDDVDIYKQEKDMLEEERLSFLDNFKPNPTKTTIGFVIMGGSFSEGIDLVSDRLIGAVIVGIGMPRINYVSDRIMAYYDEKMMNGRNYAYIFPGMNKVMQAVGRVIRDENDRGAVLLIDERYTLNTYQDLFKKEWSNYQIVYNPDDVKKNLDKFYQID